MRCARVESQAEVSGCGNCAVMGLVVVVCALTLQYGHGIYRALHR